MFNFIKKRQISARFEDEILFEYVLDELEAGIKIRGLWAKAYANAVGDSNAVEPLYMQYRVQSIKDYLVALKIIYKNLSKSELSIYLKNNLTNNTPYEEETIAIPIEKKIIKYPVRNDSLIWTDSSTNLMWEVKTRDKKDLTYTWDEAVDYCKQLNKNKFYKFNDWRIPTTEELQTLVDTENANELSIKTQLIKNCHSSFGSFYWTSTKAENSASQVYQIYFGYNIAIKGNKVDKGAIRCVRYV